MSNEREKRARLSHACDRCRKRHVKCDGDYPICGNCKSVNGECSYSHPGSKRGYVETIDDRLNKIEQVLSKYLEGVDTQQQYSKSSVTKDINNDPELDVHDIVNMAKSLKIKESSETAQVLSDSMSPSILKSNTRYVTPKKKEVSDITFHSNLSPKGSMEDLQNSSKDSKKIQSLEPPLPKVYRGSKELPPKDLFDHLIQTYLSYGYSSRGPIIHKPTFIKQLRDKNNQPSLLLLNAIFAVASIFSDDTRTRTDPDDPGTAGDIFWTRALSLLDDFMDRGRLSTVQALLFMIQFCVKSTQNSTRIWMLIGMTMRMSTDLGLNRDCSKWDIGKVEKAVRTRVFWAAMNAEVLVCASFGKPLPVYDYNTKFPYEIDDDGDEAQDVVNYMHYSKLMKIYGNVLQSKSYFSQPGALRNTLPAIDAALSSWVLALPPHLQYNPDYSDQNSISVFCSYLNQMYNTVIISLHRPYIDSDEFPNFNSRDICIKAAINITKLSNYIPVDSQGIYLTFSASAYCLVQAATMHILNIGDPDYSHIGQKYMEQTFKSLRKIAQGVRLGHGHCGVDDAINMLEYLYQVQLSKIQDDSEAQNFIRRINRNSGGGSGDGGSNRGGGNGGGGNNNDDNDHHHNKSNNKGGNNSDKIYKVKTIPTSPPSSHQQDSADGDSIKSASLSIIKTEKSPMLLDRTQQQPSSTSLSLGPRKPLSVEHLQYQRQQTHQNMQAHARVRQQQQQQQQNGDLATNHHFMGISPPMVLSPVASLAEPPVVPSSGYYNTNNFNPNMMEFTQNSQIYLGEWDVVGVGNSHHQIPTTGSSPSPSTINHNQTSANVSVLGNSTSPNHPNSPPGSNGNPTSIHQDQSSNYLSYPMNDDQNTSNLFINGSHAMINGNTVQDLGALGQNNVDGTNINVNGNNIDNNNSPHHQMMVPPHPHHPMLIQPASHSQSFSNSSTSHHVWVQQQQW